MTVKEIMERAGTTETGRAIAYIKDALEEINTISEETISLGKLAKVTGSGISFISSSTSVVTNGTDWTGATGATPPTGWTYYSEGNNAGQTIFSIDDGKLKLTHSASAEAHMIGCYQSLSVTSGVEYTLSFDFVRTGDVEVRVNSTEFAHSDSAPGNLVSHSITTAGAGAANGTVTLTFTPSTSTVYLAIGIDGSVSNYVTYDNMSVKPTNSHILDSNNRFGNFISGMKILVNDSSSNDTDDSSNASSGYYTSTAVAAGKITISDVITDESAGSTIRVRGQTSSYMDIIENKRYYSFPSDMIKLVSVKIKNHLNTKDEYRNIPRMIGEPTITDADGS